MPSGDPAPVSGSPAAQQAFDEGLNAHDRGDMALAEAKYREAVAAEPRMAVALNNLGMVLIQQDRIEEAVDCLRSAGEIDPEYAEALNNLGFAHRRLGHNVEAADCYEKFLALTPDVEDAPRIREWIAQVRVEALAAAEPPAAGPVPGSGAWVPVLEEAPAPEAPAEPPLFEQQAPAPAPAPAAEEPPPPLPEEPAATAGQARPDQPAPAPAAVPGLSEKAESEFSDMFGKLEAAPTSGQPALSAEQADEAVGHLHTEAMTKFQDGDMGEAARLCAAALEKVPGHFPTLLLAGRISLSRQDYARASTLLHSAIEVKPQDAEAHYFLGQSFEKRGLLDEAQTAYRRCVELAPEGGRAKRLNAWLEQRLTDGKAVPGQARCDMCLRSFDEAEIEQRDGQKICKSCIETLGAKVQLAKAVDDKRVEKRPPVKAMASRGRVPPLALALAAVLVLAGGYVGLGVAGMVPLPGPLADLLAPPPPPKPVKRPVVREAQTKAVPTEMTLICPPSLTVAPLEPLTVVPRLRTVWPGGATERPKNSEAVVFELVAGPAGMTADPATGALSWTPGAAGPLNVPSQHEATLKASCGGTTAQAGLVLRLAYESGTPRELDARLHGLPVATTAALAQGDLDGDGRPDLAAACGGPLRGQLSLMLSAGGSAEFNALPEYAIEGAPMGLQFADLDGDGRADLAWTAWLSGRQMAIKGCAGTQPGRPVTGSLLGGGTEGAVLADLDGDGRADLVAVQKSRGVLRVVPAAGGPALETALPDTGALPRLFVLPGRNGQRRTRLGVALSGGPLPGRLSVYEAADGRLAAVQERELPPGMIVAAAAGDFDGDGNADAVLLFGGREGALLVLDGADGRELSPLEPVPAGQLPLGLAAGDMNGDGRDDIAVCASDSVRLFLGAGRGRFIGAAEVRLLGLTGPVSIWPAGKGAPGRLAVLGLKGRVWMITPPLAAPRREAAEVPAAPPPPPPPASAPAAQKTAPTPPPPAPKPGARRSTPRKEPGT
jgi:tetratricopeptide (TPR) repeat protein